jgi:flagellar FliL protein
MQDDNDSTSFQQPEEAEGKQRSNKKWLILITCCILFLAGGVFLGYTMFYDKKEVADEKEQIKEHIKEETIPFSLDPFIVNLAESKRFLKITIEFELKNKSYEEIIKKETPKLRDIIITLLSGKSFDSLSGPEGKFQLKDEILLRANKALGNDFFKNIYFTDFVMQ